MSECNHHWCMAGDGDSHYSCGYCGKIAPLSVVEGLLAREKDISSDKPKPPVLSAAEFEWVKEQTEGMPVLSRIVEQFIDDLKAIGQTSIACKGPGYELHVEIEQRKPQ